MRVDQGTAASSGRGGSAMPESTAHLRRSAAESIEELIGATSVLRTELNAHEATCRKVLDEVRVDPVSYTHLDVYKRQVTDRASRAG